MQKKYLKLKHKSGDVFRITVVREITKCIIIREEILYSFDEISTVFSTFR
jgi:hypothetical protein